MQKVTQAKMKANQYAFNIFSGAPTSSQYPPAYTPASTSNLAVVAARV